MKRDVSTDSIKLLLKKDLFGESRKKKSGRQDTMDAEAILPADEPTEPVEDSTPPGSRPS